MNPEIDFKTRVPRTVIANVTPEMARRFLATTENQRRPIRQASVDKYVRDMQNEHWYLADPLSFDYNGALQNGNHRMAAVIQYGLPVKFRINLGNEPEAIIGFDQQESRKPHDISLFEGDPYSNAHFSIAHHIEWGEGGKLVTKKGSYCEKKEQLARYQEAVNFVCDNHHGTRGITLYVRSAIARAFYWEDHARLKRFIELLSFGSDPKYNPVEDISVLKLRDILISGNVNRQMQYLLTENAIRNFCKAKTIKVLRPAPGELYPLDRDENEKVIPDKRIQEYRIPTHISGQSTNGTKKVA